MPVLVTGPFPAAVMPGVGDIAWAPPPMAIAPLAVGEAGVAVVIAPPIAALLVATGGMAAELFAIAGADAGRVVGGATADPATVIVTALGLPGPQSAVTW